MLDKRRPESLMKIYQYLQLMVGGVGNEHRGVVYGYKFKPLGVNDQSCSIQWLSFLLLFNFMLSIYVMLSYIHSRLHFSLSGSYNFSLSLSLYLSLLPLSLLPNLMSSLTMLVFLVRESSSCHVASLSLESLTSRDLSAHSSDETSLHS